MIRQFLKDSLVYAMASLLSRGLSFLLVPYYSRFLTKTEFGLLDLVTSLVLITNTLVAAEISQGMARGYGDHKDPAERNSLFVSSLAFLVASYVVFGAILLPFRHQISESIFGDTSTSHLLVAGYVCSFFTAAQVQVNNHYRWSLQTKKAAVFSVIQTIGTLTFTVICVSALGLGAWGSLLGISISLSVLLLIELYDVRHAFAARVSWKKVGEMLRFSMPLVPSGVALFTTQFANRFVVNDLMTTDDVAVLAVASRISALVGIVMMGMGSALMPLVSAHADDPETPRKIAIIFSKIIGFSLVGVSILACFSSNWIALFSTGDYASAAPLLGLLSAATILSQFYPFAPGFWLKKKVSAMVVVNVAAAVLGVALNYALIPRFGLMGVAYATFCSAFFMVITSIYFSNKLYRIQYAVAPILGAGFSVAMLIGVHRYVLASGHGTPYRNLLYGGITVVLSFFAVVVWKLLPVHEIRMLIYEPVRARLAGKKID